MQKKSLPLFFNDSLLFSTICEYLTIKDILNLTIITRQFKELIEQYCKNILKQLKMKPSTNKSFMHQMQFYFNRCLRLVKYQKNIQTKQEIKQIIKNVTTISSPFKFQTIKHFEVGTRFVCHLSRDQKANIFKTAHLLKLNEAKEVKKQKNSKIGYAHYQSRSGIKSIHCKSDDAVILKNSGEVFFISSQKNSQQIIEGESTMLWSLRVPVKDIINSYCFTIFLFENNLSLATIMFEIFGKTIPDIAQRQQKQQLLYLLSRNMLTGKQLIIQIPCAQILDATVGSRYAYFISQNNQLYEVDLQETIHSQLPMLKAKMFMPLKGNSIVKIKNGYNYYIALERNVEHLQEWDTERVVLWLREIGFDEYIKIARVEKLDGKKLSKLQKKYMHNVLGITKQNMQQKFLMSIDQYLNKKSNNDRLWGWGKNESGQLGSSSANYVSKPQKIRFSCLHQGEYIDSIFCGWFNTFVRTQKGRIFGTKIKKEKKRKGSQKQSQKQEEYNEKQKNTNDKSSYEQYIQNEQQQNDSMHEKKGRNKLKYNKESTKKKKTAESGQQKDKNNKKFQQEDNWFQFPLGKAFFIQTYKDVLFIVQCSLQHIDEPLPSRKLRTAKAVLDKILWCNLNKDEFKVGYVDKKMGLIETNLINMSKFDVKQNTIKYFKKNNLIVWDRDNKIDML